MAKTTHLNHTLTILLTATLLLTLVGLLFIYAASSVFALEHKGTATFYLKKQSVGLVAGIICALIVSYIPSRLLQKYAWLAFLAGATITLLPLICSSYSHTIHGSTRWLSLGKGFAIQPSEILKVTLIPYIASLLTRTSATHIDPSLKHICAALSVAGCAALILLLQPDFGQAMLIMATTMCLAALTYRYPHHLLVIALPLVFMSIILILMQPYRLRRIMTFLHPWDDPRGAGFQIIQSLIAIGSGGLSGVGIAQSQQKYFYLPMQHTDFIFSIISEETGFIGALFLIILYLSLLYAGIRLALSMRTAWQTIVVSGSTVLISLEALINLAVTTGTAPTKGIGLPFVSYGVSSLIGHSCMIGIIIACARDQRNKESEYTVSASRTFSLSSNL
jgi:cell division protein FtsW